MTMRLKHPRASEGAGVAPAAVDVRGDTRAVDEDGVFEGGDEAWLQRFADRYDADPENLRVDDTTSGGDAVDGELCGAKMSDGSTCDRPADDCPYHGDDQEE